MDLECLICYDEKNANSGYITYCCGRKFCIPCIEKWNGSCPNCRSKYTSYGEFMSQDMIRLLYEHGFDCNQENFRYHYNKCIMIEELEELFL